MESIAALSARVSGELGDEAATDALIQDLTRALEEAREEGALRRGTLLLRLLGQLMARLERGEAAVAALIRALRGAGLLGDMALYGAAMEDLVALFEGVLEPYAHAAEFQRDVQARLRAMLERWLRFTRPDEDEDTSTSNLYVSQEEKTRYLRGEEAPSDLEVEGASMAPESLQAALIARLRASIARGGAEAPPLGRVVVRLGLSPLEVWLLLILLMGQIDPATRRVYTYSWNDFSQKLPDVAFLSGMLFGEPSPIWSAVDGLLAPSSPLAFYRLVEVSGNQTGVRRVRLSDSALRLLQGVDGLSADLLEWCALTSPGAATEVEGAPDNPLTGWLTSWFAKADAKAAAKASSGGAPTDASGSGQVPLRVLLRGASRGERRRVAQEAAGAAGKALIAADLSVVRRRGYEALTAALGSLARDALLGDAAVLLEIPAAPREEVPGQGGGAEAVSSALLKGLERFDVPVILGLEINADGYVPALTNILEADVPMVPLDRQGGMWHRALERRGLPELTEAELDDVVRRHPLDANTIEEVCDELALLNTLGTEVDAGRLAATAGRKAASALGGVAQRLSTPLGWGDVALPVETMESVMEIISFARYRNTVMDDWGFGAKMPYGKGLSALFWGPPGTGKTMMAGLIANEIGMELFRVDVSQVVSKFLGETEKNLGRIFDQAAQNNAIILFDEADSLFAKRTKVSSSNDRYANLEVNFLLQRMEAFEGVTLLTTNLESSIDEAFKRRIRFKVHFPFPEPEERAVIWQIMVPREAKTSPDVNWARLGKTFKMSGGLIRSAVIRAAFTAAERGDAISMEDFWDAGCKEVREMGGLVHEKLHPDPVKSRR